MEAKTRDSKQQVMELLTTDKTHNYFTALDKAAREGTAKLTYGQMYALRAWEESRDAGLSIIEARELPWGSQIKDGQMKAFVDTLREAGVDEITVTETSTALMEIIHALVAEGATMEGVSIVDRGEEWNASAHPGIDFRL